MIYLDTSKAFDRVWHHGLLFKLKSIEIRDPLLAWFKSYLSDLEQRVIIDGQSSEWTSVEAGVPQGCVLGLGLLFLIYINDITQNIKFMLTIPLFPMLWKTQLFPFLNFRMI